MDIQPIIFPNLPQRLSGLGELAENLWWSWNPAARKLFKTLDRQAWKKSVYNPDKMLKELPQEIFERAIMTSSKVLLPKSNICSMNWASTRSRAPSPQPLWPGP